MIITDKIADLSLLWKQASAVFPHFHRLGLDWDGAYRAYLDRALETGSDWALHLLLMEFMNLLGDGHTGYTPPRPLLEETGFLPFSLLYTRGGYYIRAIEEAGAAHLLGKVLSINGVAFADVLSQAFRLVYHVDGYASPTALDGVLPFFLRREGNELETSQGVYRFGLRSARPPMRTFPAPRCAAAFTALPSGKLDIRLYEGNVLYVRLDNLLYAGASDEIAGAMDRAGELCGVILDLRENIGGMTLYGAKVAELFLSGQFHGCRKWTRIMEGLDAASGSQYARMNPEELARMAREGLGGREEIERCMETWRGVRFRRYVDTFGAPDHRSRFDGPCVLLTARGTVSAAEDLTAMFRSNRRARLIGTATYGSTGTPLLETLRCGGRARVCSVGYCLLDGTEFIGQGIQPDVPAENRAEDLARGRDRVLDTAVEWLRGEK